MPKLFALTPYPTRSADTRYRIEQFMPALESAGWKVTLRPFMNERLFTIYNQPGEKLEKIGLTLKCLMERLKDLAVAEKADVVLLHKEAFPFGPPWIEKAFRKRAKTIIYDMDDAYWTHPPQFRQIGNKFRDPKRIQKILGMSDIILAGNDFLAEYARQYNPNVIVFPTVLDTERYRLREESDDGIVTIGWVGRWSSEAYLEQLLPVFEKLAINHPNIGVKLIGASPNVFSASFPVQTTPWRLESEIDDIASLDIGIMPLPDDQYSRGKCGFKLLQYMALGIPSVASPVGVNKLIINDGVNGYLAKDNEEWFIKLDSLIKNLVKRKAIGYEGRKTVEEKYSLDKAVPLLIDILNRDDVK